MVKADLFYVYDRLVSSTDPAWIQSAFDTLMGIFDQVGMHINIHKNVGMVCTPYWSARVQADEAYTQKMKRVGRSFKERQWERVL